MKLIIIFTFFLVGLTINQDTKLKGRYFVAFKNKNFQKDGYIDFDNKTFTMKPTNLLPYSGTVNYYRTITMLKSDSDKDIIIDFRTDELQNDTIKFQVHCKKAGVINYLDITINQGKLIKIK